MRVLRGAEFRPDRGVESGREAGGEGGAHDFADIRTQGRLERRRLRPGWAQPSGRASRIIFPGLHQANPGLPSSCQHLPSIFAY